MPRTSRHQCRRRERGARRTTARPDLVWCALDRSRARFFGLWDRLPSRQPVAYRSGNVHCGWAAGRREAATRVDGGVLVTDQRALDEFWQQRSNDAARHDHPDPAAMAGHTTMFVFGSVGLDVGFVDGRRVIQGLVPLMVDDAVGRGLDGWSVVGMAEDITEPGEDQGECQEEDRTQPRETGTPGIASTHRSRSHSGPPHRYDAGDGAV